MPIIYRCFKNTHARAFFMAALLALPLSTDASAQELESTDLSKGEIVDIMPAKSLKDGVSIDENTHPPIRLTPDKSEIVNLDRNAASVIIGNPLHLSIHADAANRLVLVPRAPGASYFTILDRNGDVIMQRHAIVASPKQEYVRIRRSCANGGDNCQETSVFYCPDMCHEIKIDTSDSNTSSAAAIPASTSQTSSEEDEPVPVEEGALAE